MAQISQPQPQPQPQLAVPAGVWRTLPDGL